MVLENEVFYPPAATDGILYPEMMLPPPQELEEALEERARSILAKAGESLRENGLEAEIKTARGSAAREIIKEAEEGSYDLVIMGRHGHGLLKGFLIGSVSDRVVRHAPCPVLVVH
jgi:nucleotide-binding universal stress UspA family protein